jgi:hypothetical protein
MTKRLELYDWPKDSRTVAEEMYKIARTLLLEARRLRAKPWPGEGECEKTARYAAKLILDQIRMGRDNDVFFHRKMIREAVERSIAPRIGEPQGLGGYMFDVMCIKGTGLDRREFDEKTPRQPTER